MPSTPNRFLLTGAALSAAAALLHVGCIVFGAPWYRALGAGEGMAQLAAAGHPRPTLFALFIASVLLLWACYALSGAGAIRRLPLLKPALCIITAIYLARGIGFVALKPYFPGNSLTFWLISSGICLGFGLVHLVGLKQRWRQL
jgi:hypothetical protein